MKICCYCNESFPDSVCRPYGPKAAYCCFPCGTKPENEPETERQMDLRLDMVMKPILDGIAELGLTPDGPIAVPIIPKKDPFGSN